jgi:hypothetical protein
MPAVLQKKGGNLFFFRHIYIRGQKIDTTDYIISLYNIINRYNGKEHFWRN